MEYVRENPVMDITDTQKKNQLINSIISTRDELNKAHKNFEYAEGDLIDFYTYQIRFWKPRIVREKYLSSTRCLMLQFSSVAQSCPTLCDPMDYSTPGLPAYHQLPEFTQIHALCVGDAIQPQQSPSK